ncbi:MAG: restriction endonuclease [Clostridia bacterium]|nr:restriction endonuclease [Clostridia bacterium]
MDISYLKKNQRSVKAKIRRDFIDILSSCDKIAKGELFKELFARSELTEEQVRESSVDSAGVLYRALIGAVLCEGIENAEVTDENGVIYLNRDMPIYIRESEVKEYVKNLFKENKPLTKREIFNKCIRAFGTDKTLSERDDNRLRAYIGDFLAASQRASLITVSNGRYYMSQEKENILDSYEQFLNSVNSRGGEYFERYGAMLLKKFYEKAGVEVFECDVTGGSDDGGVDIELRTRDKLGFVEYIAVQAKARRSAQVSVKEVREFIGAMHTKNATRGIYLTTSTFHPNAQALIDKIYNVTAIDGKKLYALARECSLMRV